MKNLSKKHLKHLWNRYLFYSNYISLMTSSRFRTSFMRIAYNKEILNPEDLPMHQWIDQKENNLFRRLNREGEKIGYKIYIRRFYYAENNKGE